MLRRTSKQQREVPTTRTTSRITSTPTKTRITTTPTTVRTTKATGSNKRVPLVTLERGKEKQRRERDIEPEEEENEEEEKIEEMEMEEEEGFDIPAGNKKAVKKWVEERTGHREKVVRIMKSYREKKENL